MVNPSSQDRHSQWHIVLWYHLPALCYAGLIIGLSSIPNLSPVEIKTVAFDKVAHFIEYAIFAFLVFRSVSQIRRSISTRAIVIWSAVFLTCFATLDELYQRTVPGRHMDPLDLTADIIGALLVLSLLGYRRKKYSND